VEPIVSNDEQRSKAKTILSVISTRNSLVHSDLSSAVRECAGARRCSRSEARLCLLASFGSAHLVPAAQNGLKYSWRRDFVDAITTGLANSTIITITWNTWLHNFPPAVKLKLVPVENIV
jgi:hypothetical protein